MTAIDTALRTIHLSFAALWVGAVLFVTLAVLPVARDGGLDAEPLTRLVGRLRTVSRASALVLLVTGGHLTATGYTVGRLVGTTRGHLVLAMVGLWFALAAVLEVGSSRLADELREKRVRAPARDALGWFRVASLLAVGLLVDAGLLAT